MSSTQKACEVSGCGSLVSIWLSAVGPLAIVLQVRDELAQETDNLRRSWAHHEPSWLRDYLVAGVEDPRVNLQSILTRHFLIRYLTGTEFEWSMTREYEFSAAAAWLATHAGLLADGETRLAVLHALRRGADNAEGIEVPQFVSSAFSRLSADGRIPNYLEAVTDTASGRWRCLARVVPQYLRGSLGTPAGEHQSSANELRKYQRVTSHDREARTP